MEQKHQQEKMDQDKEKIEQEKREWEEKMRDAEASINLQKALMSLLRHNQYDVRSTLIQFCNIMRSLGIEFDLKQMFEDDEKEKEKIEKDVDEILASIEREQNNSQDKKKSK